MRILEFTPIRILHSQFEYDSQDSSCHSCIQSGIVRKKLGFEARCYIIVIYLNVGYNIAIYLNVGTLILDAINVKIQLSPTLS
jgi:hypothetical protein